MSVKEFVEEVLEAGRQFEENEAQQDYKAPPPNAEDLAADPTMALLELKERHGMENAQIEAERLMRDAQEFAADLNCWRVLRTVLSARQRRELYNLADDGSAEDPTKILRKYADLCALAGRWSPFHEEAVRGMDGNVQKHLRAMGIIFDDDCRIRSITPHT